MSASNLMDLTGSGSVNFAVTTVPPSTTHSHHSHSSNGSSEDEETVAIVLACVLITVIVAAFCRWVYGMARDKRKELAGQEDEPRVIMDEPNEAPCAECNCGEGKEGTSQGDAEGNACEAADAASEAAGAEGKEGTEATSTEEATSAKAEVTDV